MTKARSRRCEEGWRKERRAGGRRGGLEEGEEVDYGLKALCGLLVFAARVVIGRLAITSVSCSMSSRTGRNIF
jgi:hypothetical protein